MAENYHIAEQTMRMSPKTVRARGFSLADRAAGQESGGGSEAQAFVDVFDEKPDSDRGPGEGSSGTDGKVRARVSPGGTARIDTTLLRTQSASSVGSQSESLGSCESSSGVSSAPRRMEISEDRLRALAHLKLPIGLPIGMKSADARLPKLPIGAVDPDRAKKSSLLRDPSAGLKTSAGLKPGGTSDVWAQLSSALRESSSQSAGSSDICRKEGVVTSAAAHCSQTSSDSDPHRGEQRMPVNDGSAAYDPSSAAVYDPAHAASKPPQDEIAAKLEGLIAQIIGGPGEKPDALLAAAQEAIQRRVQASKRGEAGGEGADRRGSKSSDGSKTRDDTALARTDSAGSSGSTCLGATTPGGGSKVPPLTPNSATSTASIATFASDSSLSCPVVVGLAGSQAGLAGLAQPVVYRVAGEDGLLRTVSLPESSASAGSKSSKSSKRGEGLDGSGPSSPGGDSGDDKASGTEPLSEEEQRTREELAHQKWLKENPHLPICSVEHHEEPPEYYANYSMSLAEFFEHYLKIAKQDAGVLFSLCHSYSMFRGESCFFPRNFCTGLFQRCVSGDKMKNHISNARVLRRGAWVSTQTKRYTTGCTIPSG